MGYHRRILSRVRAIESYNALTRTTEYPMVAHDPEPAEAPVYEEEVTPELITILEVIEETYPQDDE